MNEDDNKSSVSIRIQYIILPKSGITVIIIRYLSTGARRQPLVPMSDQPSYYEYQSQHNRLPVSVNKFRSTDGNVLIHSKDTKPVGFLQFLTTVLMAEMLRTNLM